MRGQEQGGREEMTREYPRGHPRQPTRGGLCIACCPMSSVIKRHIHTSVCGLEEDVFWAGAGVEDDEEGARVTDDDDDDDEDDKEGEADDVC